LSAFCAFNGPRWHVIGGIGAAVIGVATDYGWL
jgi:hypothetical protein